MRWVLGVWGEERFVPVTERASLLDVYLSSAGTRASELLTCTEETNSANCSSVWESYVFVSLILLAPRVLVPWNGLRVVC